MSVSGELLCSFELLKPLDSTQLKQQMKKSKHRRSSLMPQSPVCACYKNLTIVNYLLIITCLVIARDPNDPECLDGYDSFIRKRYIVIRFISRR